MQYLLLIYDSENRFAAQAESAMHAELIESRAFGEAFASAIRIGDALQPTFAATTVRVRDGKRVISDGAFAETHEQLGAFYVVEAQDLDDAIDMAAKIPAARVGSIEVRPIRKFSTR
jgi:hypothetical protein